MGPGTGPGTATEGNDRPPVRSPAGQEEEEEAVTPIPSHPSIGWAGEGGAPSPPASNISGCGTEATDPDDDTRPVTKQEFTRFRHRVEKTFQRMYADVMGLLNHEVREQDRQREALKEMMVGRMETLVPMGREFGVEEGHRGPQTDKVP